MKWPDDFLNESRLNQSSGSYFPVYSWFTCLEQSSCNYSGNQNPSCFPRTAKTVLSA